MLIYRVWVQGEGEDIAPYAARHVPKMHSVLHCAPKAACILLHETLLEQIADLPKTCRRLHAGSNQLSHMYYGICWRLGWFGPKKGKTVQDLVS